MVDATMIPQMDVKAGYLAHRPEIDAALHRVLDSGWYIGGEEVAAFEREFAAFLGVRHAVACASGTDALTLALRTVGIVPGDLVLTVSHTAVATVAAAELAGARVGFVDIDPATYTMDPQGLEAAVRRLAAGSAGALKAVIPVHLYGHPADMPRLMDTAARYGLRVIEDCAQAHGAAIAGRTVGGWGSLAAFSFYPTKNLGALGDGGAVATNDDALAERARLLREYGWKERYTSHLAGMNTRLDPVQAAILRVKLRHLAAENERRREIARSYGLALGGTGLVTPSEAPGCRHVFHQYVVRSPARDALRAHLKAANIGSLVHYPLPVHHQPAYRDRLLLPEGGLPQTERVCREILSLPMYPQLAAADVRRVTAAIGAWAQR